jgi:MoaA/NifB/PqqE/SkfB family radical SAM enzyme
MLTAIGSEIRQYMRGLPTVASLGITERCKFHCKMCRFWLNVDHEPERELGTRDFINMIDELIDDLGVRRFRLMGGEPFMRSDAIDLIRHGKARGAKFSAVSDGSCIDAELGEEIVRSGLDSIRFSIDGIGKAHDRVRGVNGAYDTVSTRKSSSRACGEGDR